MSQSLLVLPVVRWARRFGPGTVRVDGTLDQALELESGPVAPGRVCVELVFEGGKAPALRASRVGIGRGPERALAGTDDAGLLVGKLSDVEVEARTQASQTTEMPLAAEVRLVLEPEVVVTVSASARGPAGALRLARPIAVGFSGEGARLRHGGLHRLSRWADLRLRRAVLHPDGRVRLEGGGRRGLDLTARAGLGTASAAVTRLVRSGQRFRSLQGFLDL